MLCTIGLPGFAASIALGVVAILSLLFSLAIIDKVGKTHFYGGKIILFFSSLVVSLSS